ncbi:hypothetical protein QHI69_13740 [Burkholderia gladioli pv. gladioli]|uniref:hypothetical protein n=1 Tax=Burkholderia gladioli TaxID=28095 RepID=UPI0024BC32A0|nr:hypothetical protein [Burkholderia gladioli]MDJ1162962.1 hypothetical protein [Burkholderia gladioli pv. gladioli]
MSEVASLVQPGEYHSAWFYRDLYLHDETRYEKFLCPFCGIKVFAVLIYEPAGEELSRSPHFRKSEEHRHGCDGNPEKGLKTPAPTGPVRKIETQLFTLPTRLIEYVEPPARADRDERTEVAKPSPEEVKKRRLEAGETHHRARFSVALVQSLAEAHLGTIRQSYQLQEKKKWSDKQRRDWLKAVFSTEIDLRGATMRFDRAFHDLYFPVGPTPRVYYGTADVIETPDGYLLKAHTRGRADKHDKHGLPFQVWVRVDKDVMNLRGARRELMGQLKRAAEHDFPVKWYGLGRPRRGESSFDLHFDAENLTDLFVRRQPVKKGHSLPKAASGHLVNRPADHQPPPEFSEPRGIRQDRPAQQNLASDGVGDPEQVKKPAVDTRVAQPKRVTEPAGLIGGPVANNSAVVSADKPTVSKGPLQHPDTQMPRSIKRSEVRLEAPGPVAQAGLETVPSQTMPSIERTETVVNESTLNRPSGATDSQARRSVWLAAVQKEFDAVCVEQTEIAAKIVTTFRMNVLNPHRERKPLFFGRSAWKTKLAELEANDQRNVARWKRLQQRQLTSQEVDEARKEAARRVGLDSNEDASSF